MLSDEKEFSFTSYQEERRLSRALMKPAIDWLFEIGDFLRQTNLTTHIAIAYLERACLLGLDKGRSETKMRTLAFTCLLLASKYDELDERIPYVKDAIKKLKVDFGSYGEILACEELLLKSFHWNLVILTPVHFVYSLV